MSEERSQSKRKLKTQKSTKRLKPTKSSNLRSPSVLPKELDFKSISTEKKIVKTNKKMARNMQEDNEVRLIQDVQKAHHRLVSVTKPPT